MALRISVQVVLSVGLLVVVRSSVLYTCDPARGLAESRFVPIAGCDVTRFKRLFAYGGLLYIFSRFKRLFAYGVSLLFLYLVHLLMRSVCFLRHFSWLPTSHDHIAKTRKTSFFSLTL